MEKEQVEAIIEEAPHKQTERRDHGGELGRAVGWSLALARQFIFGYGGVVAERQQVGLCGLPTEVVMHVLSFVADARDLCSLALVCRTLEVASRDDSLWRPLGHASWADHHAREHGGWKGAYMRWLRVAVAQYGRSKRATLAPRAVADGGGDRAQQATTTTITAKVVMLGVVNVGKTSLLKRYLAHPPWRSFSSATPSFEIREVTWNATTRVKLELWDTHGAERFNAMSSMYFRSARGVALVYDVADRSSFAGAASWMADLRGEYARHLADDVRVVLVGNKTDLSSEGNKRVVTEREGRKQAEEWGVSFCECSAKTGEGVDALFNLLVEQMMSGWAQVAGMATPAHVPDEVTLAAAALCSSTATGQDNTSGSSSQLCLLQ